MIHNCFLSLGGLTLCEALPHSGIDLYRVQGSFDTQSGEMALCSLKYWEGADLCFAFLKNFKVEKKTKNNTANIL